MINTCKAALRQLQRSAGFSFTVILILAIGIGVTTAMYSVLYAVVLQPLPFPEPDRLVALSAKPWDNLSFPTLQDWQRRTQAFQSMAAYAGWSPHIESTAGVGHADATLVSKNFLSTLGASLALGQDFTQTGNEAGCLDQAIVTDAYWRRMGGGNSLTGRTSSLTTRPTPLLAFSRLSRPVAIWTDPQFSHRSAAIRQSLLQIAASLGSRASAVCGPAFHLWRPLRSSPPRKVRFVATTQTCTPPPSPRC
jgi:hypothetical protein